MPALARAQPWSYHHGPVIVGSLWFGACLVYVPDVALYLTPAFDRLLSAPNLSEAIRSIASPRAPGFTHGPIHRLGWSGGFRVRAEPLRLFLPQSADYRPDSRKTTPLNPPPQAAERPRTPDRTFPAGFFDTVSSHRPSVSTKNVAFASL